MTGMGNDGAEGLGKLAQLGAITIAQTPDSCVCHGMPKSAIDRGYASAASLRRNHLSVSRMHLRHTSSLINRKGKVT